MKRRIPMNVRNAARTLLIAAVVFLLVSGCGKRYDGPSADLVIRNATVVTVDPGKPRVGAVAVRGETILAVTSDRKVDQYIEEGKTRIIDARGKLVVPGFNDAHAHVMSGGKSLVNLDFRYVSDVSKIQSMVRERVRKSRPGELIRGRGWDHELFPDKRWPRKEVLDAEAGNNPVMLSRVDGHSVWVNSYLLRQSGIDRHTPDPSGGTIVRDPETGEPTGILKEKAVNLLVFSSDYALSEEDSLEQEREAMLLALEEARRCGVTSLQHLNGNLDLLRDLKEEGLLTCRFTCQLWLTDDPQKLARYDSLRAVYPPENNWVRAGYLKGFIDGTLGSGTALMFEPFSDDPDTRGLPQMEYGELEKRVVMADSMRFQIGIHAIGTRGNHWVLNAYEKARERNGTRDSRHRIEHAQILIPGDIPRFAALGVIPSMQPTHCITDKRFAEKRLGLERCGGAYAWRSLLDTEADVAFGTDWPVEPLDPLEGLYAAVTRKDRNGKEGEGWFPEERLTLEEAIELYTAGAAYAEFMEDRKGRIKPGYLADMVIFDRNLFTIPPEEIMKARVVMTIVGGRVVYEEE
jgi:predicted amidohydrolase YtcJ